MVEFIESDILQEAKRHAERYQAYHNYMHLEHQRRKKRLKTAPEKKIHIPDAWSVDDKFNPFYVIKRHKQIANSIIRKLKERNYSPNTPFEKEIPKRSGGARKLTIFQIPDAAVSHRLYSNLLSKNKHRFSTLSYAYRNDRNAHYAIQDIAVDFKKSPRLYIAEFDFSNFFLSINHEFLFSQFNQNGFLISNFEEYLIKEFLRYNHDGVGIPLGSAISLFLANLACWELDRELEKIGLRFARYADDTIIWSTDYSKVSKSFDIIHEFSKQSGVKINEKKSDGISQLSRPSLVSELAKSKSSAEFLGYYISNASIGIKEKSVTKIKNWISFLLYRTLIQPVQSYPFKAKELPQAGKDRDFLSAISQVRRYMYGNLSEENLVKYLSGEFKHLSFKGIMSYYPLVEDNEQLLDLDRWLVSTILNTLQKRKRLIEIYAPSVTSAFPFDLTGLNIIERCKKARVDGKKGLLEIPSFLRIKKAIEKKVIEEGIAKAMHPNSNIYNYFE